MGWSPDASPGVTQNPAARDGAPGAAVTSVPSSGPGRSFQTLGRTAFMEGSLLRCSCLNHLPLGTESLDLQGGPWGCKFHPCDLAFVFLVTRPSPERLGSTKNHLVSTDSVRSKVLITNNQIWPFLEIRRVSGALPGIGDEDRLYVYTYCIDSLGDSGCIRGGRRAWADSDLITEFISKAVS